MDEANQNPQTQNTFTKQEFNSLVKQALSQVEKIAAAYKKLFDSSEGQESVVGEIETRLEDVREKYEHLFSTNEAGGSRVAELNAQIDEIKKYHQELLAGASSIRTDIEESHGHIKDFFTYLFGDNDGVGDKEHKVREAIEKILGFHLELTKEDGLKKTIEDIKEEIENVYDDLFSEDEEGDSRISSLNKDIEQIKAFRATLDKDIEPFIRETRDDIEAKRKDAAALLRQATGGALVDGFLQSKREYRGLPNYLKLNGSRIENAGRICFNAGAYLYGVFILLFDYVLFVFPLLISVFIFVNPDMVAVIVGNGSEDGSLSELLGGLDFYGRLIISLPLWWISWFGQRSISHKRRLAEEYNHKAQVTTMYLNFVSEDTEKSYPLETKAKARLHKELIDVIARHPGQVYGRDETMIDKVIQLISAVRGVKIATTEGEQENKNS